MLDKIKISKKKIVIVIINCLLLLLFILWYTETYAIDDIIIWIVSLLMLEESFYLQSYFFPKERRQEQLKQKLAVLILDILTAIIFIYMFMGIAHPKVERNLLFGKYILYIWIPLLVIKGLIQMSIDGAIKID